MDKKTRIQIAMTLRAVAQALGAPSSAALSIADFAALVERLARVGDKQLLISKPGRNDIDSDSLFINFINLPKGYGDAGGGAEAENNRAMYSIRGFNKSPDKLTVKEVIGLHESGMRMRAKSGPPEAIAKYLAAHLTKLATAPSRWTHTDPP